jgi:methyl coenzyme M reductase gamma subunit
MKDLWTKAQNGVEAGINSYYIDADREVLLQDVTTYIRSCMAALNAKGIDINIIPHRIIEESRINKDIEERRTKEFAKHAIRGDES